MVSCGWICWIVFWTTWLLVWCASWYLQGVVVAIALLHDVFMGIVHHLSPRQQEPVSHWDLIWIAYHDIPHSCFESSSWRERRQSQRENDKAFIPLCPPLTMPPILPPPEPPPWFRFWWMLEDWEVCKASDAWDYLPPLPSWTQLVNNFVDSHNPIGIVRIHRLGMTSRRLHHPVPLCRSVP